MPFTPSIAKYQEQDPAEFVKGLANLAIVKPVTYASATQTLGTIPAYSIINRVRIIRTTKWNSAPTAFEIGKGGNTTWLANTTQANVSGNIPSGEDAGVETIEINKAVIAATDIVLTLNQGSATAGAGYVVVEFQEMVR